MIVFFVGTPGSGKSYEAVKKIVDNLKIGRTVCTNIDGMDLHESQQYLKSFLDMDDYLFHQRFRFLDRDQIKQFWKTETIHHPQRIYDVEDDVFNDVVRDTEELICPLGSLIIIDEAHKFFNAHDHREDTNRQLADWASTHRHLGYDLVFITQDIGKVDKQVRTLTEWSFCFRKVNFFGGAVKKKYLCYSYSGDDHHGTPIAKNVRTYDPSYFPAYQSYSSKDAKEVGFMSTVNILRHPVFYAIPVILCFCAYMFFAKSSFATGDIFGTSKVQKRYTKQVAENKKPTVSVPFKNLSSPKLLTPPAAAQAAPVVAAAFPVVAPVSDYVSHKVDGYILMDGKTTIQINGIVVRLPSPFVRSFDRQSGYGMFDSNYFMLKKETSGNTSTNFPPLKPYGVPN